MAFQSLPLRASDPHATFPHRRPPHRRPLLALTPGRHTIRAKDAQGRGDEVTIVVR